LAMTDPLPLKIRLPSTIAAAMLPSWPPATRAANPCGSTNLAPENLPAKRHFEIWSVVLIATCPCRCAGASDRQIISWLISSSTRLISFPFAS
jgi:hypothetical protein